MRRPLNWWYFLFWSGIFVPAIYHLLTNSAFEFDYFRSNPVLGSNPPNTYSLMILNFAPTLIITVVFKILDSKKINRPIKTLMYILFGIIFELFIVSGFITRKFEYIQNQSHRYFSYLNEFKWSDTTVKYYYLFANAAIVLIFLYFFIRNFPRRSGKQS